MCNKIGYPDKKAAMDDIRYITIQNRFLSKKASTHRKSGKYRAYRCPHCDKWHLTTQKPRNKKGAKGW